MDKPLVEKEIGPEADLLIEVKEGKIFVGVEYEGSGGGAKVVAFAKADYFIDKLTEAIPGEVDDMIGAALKEALK